MRGALFTSNPRGAKKPMTNSIYFDNAATTPLDPMAELAIAKYNAKSWGNSASGHEFGQRSLKALDESRQKIADFLGAKSLEIIFTSGATEANNLAVRGIISASKIKQPHVIVSAIEHQSILEPCRQLHEKQIIELTEVCPEVNGITNIEEIITSIKENTIFISLMLANNELGIVNPVRELGKKIKKLNETRKNKIIFHSDIVQAVQFENCRADYLKADLLTLSAHKIYGPTGIGALYVRSGIALQPELTGGSQEFVKRAGTVNVAGAVGFSQAISELNQKTADGIINLRKSFESRLKKELPSVKIIGEDLPRIGIANIYFPKIDGQVLLIALDRAGLAASAGSACEAGATTESHVIASLGEYNKGSNVRFSFSKHNTETEIVKAVNIISETVKKIS